MSNGRNARTLVDRSLLGKGALDASEAIFVSIACTLESYGGDSENIDGLDPTPRSVFLLFFFFNIFIGV